MNSTEPDFVMRIHPNLDSGIQPSAEYRMLSEIPPEEQEARKSVSDRLDQVFPHRIFKESVFLCGMETASVLRRSMPWASCQIRLGYLQQLINELRSCFLSEHVKMVIVGGGESELQSGFSLQAVVDLYKGVLGVIRNKWPNLPILVLPPLRFPPHVTEPMIRVAFDSLRAGFKVRVALVANTSAYDMYGVLRFRNMWRSDGQLAPDGRRRLSELCKKFYDEQQQHGPGATADGYEDRPSTSREHSDSWR
jgi:hypothetical protein